jgi:hypothetical protein
VKSVFLDAGTLEFDILTVGNGVDAKETVARTQPPELTTDWKQLGKNSDEVRAPTGARQHLGPMKTTGKVGT